MHTFSTNNFIYFHIALVVTIKGDVGTFIIKQAGGHTYKNSSVRPFLIATYFFVIKIKTFSSTTYEKTRLRLIILE